MSAYGDNPQAHHIVDGSFVCTAPDGAECRAYPTCECETWNVSGTVEGEHDCMTTTRPGQPCWMAEWVHTDSIGESYGIWKDHGRPTGCYPDGPVTCEWDDSVSWTYADGTTPIDATEDDE